MTHCPIPALSLTALPDAVLADKLGASFREFGFAIVTDHGIPHPLVERAWTLAAQMFAMPDVAKRAYAIDGLAGQRGYTPFGTEIAKGAHHHDLKEFWHVGRSRWADPALGRAMPDNVWPEEMPDFARCFTTLYDAFEACGARILSAIALHLGLSPGWFDAAIRDGNSILRLLHYPPVSGEGPAIRAGAHEDINLITLLLGAQEAGLQLRSHSGEWLTIDPPPGTLVVNIGDMLQRLTNSVLPSTTHRVINPAPERQGHSRYSMPFFLHLRPDFLITPLPGCVDADRPARENPITAEEYLAERLREIGLG